MKDKSRLKLVGVLILVAVFLTGCAGMRKNIIKLSEEDKANIEAVNTAAKNLMETWPTYSGAINGWFQNDQGKMPVEFWATVNMLDQIVCHYYSDKYPEEFKDTINCQYVDGEPTDWELGYTLSTRALLLKQTIIELLKRLAPEFLEVFPLALLGD